MKKNLTVAKASHEGIWDWGKISFDLPKEIKDKIMAIPIQIFGEKEDSLI